MLGSAILFSIMANETREIRGISLQSIRKCDVKSPQGFVRVLLGGTTMFRADQKDSDAFEVRRGTASAVCGYSSAPLSRIDHAETVFHVVSLCIERFLPVGVARKFSSDGTLPRLLKLFLRPSCFQLKTSALCAPSFCALVVATLQFHPTLSP